MKYKKILFGCILAFGLSNIALADDASASSSATASSNFNPGIYFGGQVGASNMHYSGSKYTVPANSVESYKFAGRGYLGYAFSPFISLELGYDYYGKPKFKHDPTGNTQEFTQQGIDLVGKANLPLDYGFGFYVKGGAAWVDRGSLNSNTGFFASKESNNKIVPVGGLGINYWFAPNMALDLGWTKTMTIGDLPTIDFYSLGFIYKLNI